MFYKHLINDIRKLLKKKRGGRCKQYLTPTTSGYVGKYNGHTVKLIHITEAMNK